MTTTVTVDISINENSTYVWDKTLVPPWIDLFISRSLSNLLLHENISELINWKHGEITQDFEAGFPYKRTIRSEMVALEADVSLNGRRADIKFALQPNMVAYDFDFLFDGELNKALSRFKRATDPEEMAPFLGKEIAAIAISDIQGNDSMAKQVLVPKLISPETFNKIKYEIKEKASRFSLSCETLPTKNIAVSSILSFFFFFFMAVSLNLYLPSNIDAKELGFSGLPADFDYFLYDLFPRLALSDVISVLMLTIILTPLAIAIWGAKASNKKISKIAWGLPVFFAICIITFQVLNIVSQADPGAIYWWSLGLIPDLILLSMLSGIFRTKKKVSQELTAAVAKTKSPAFIKFLGY